MMDMDSRDTVSQIKAVFTDPRARASFIDRNRLNIILYTLLFAFILFVYHVLSDGDFSFFLTLGAIVRMFGFVILLLKLHHQKSSAGISLKTLELYALVFAARLCSILVYEGYLPFDKSGDWLYQAVELTSLALSLVIIFYALNMDYPYNFSEDGFGNLVNIPSHFGPVVLIVPCLFLALLFHPTLNKNFFTDTAWTFAAYLETVAVLPQFYLLQKLNKPVENWISHFVFSLGLSRLFLFIFWASSFHELTNRRSSFFLAGFEGYLVLAVQFVHIAIMAEFCFYYLLAAREQIPLVIPSLDV